MSGSKIGGLDATGGGITGLDYRMSGVDIAAEGQAVRALVRALTFRRAGLGSPLSLPGHFTGFVEFGEWALGLCTDGVGSKMLIAEAMGRFDTVGIDCVAMNVNDMICVGGEPVAFVDYLAMAKPDPAVTAQIGIGLNRGAQLANVSVIGGETASLPDMISGVDLAGTCLGIVRRDRLISGEGIEDGDAVVAIPSSGLHSNGYSLARAALKKAGVGLGDPWPHAEPEGASTVGEALLAPTAIYVRAVLELIEAIPVHGLAHITGGGFRNLNRLKRGIVTVIDNPLPVPPVFAEVQRWGDIDDAEMYATFNMGMGFVAVVPPDRAKEAASRLGALHPGASVVGRVELPRGPASGAKASSGVSSVIVEPLNLELEGY